jgi:hypothetical protein
MAVILCSGYLNEGAFALPIGIGHQEKGEFVNMRIVENVIIRDFNNEHCCATGESINRTSWEGHRCAPHGYGFIFTCFEDKSPVEKLLPFQRNWRGCLGWGLIDIRLGYNPVDYCGRSPVISESIFNLWDYNWKLCWEGHDFRGIQENIGPLQFGKSAFGYIGGLFGGIGRLCRYSLCSSKKINLNVGNNTDDNCSDNKPECENRNRVREQKINDPAKRMLFFIWLFLFGLSGSILFIWIGRQGR